MERTIVIRNKAGKVIATAAAKSNAQRFSVRCAADQRQIDSMYRKGAATAELLNADGEVWMRFTFVRGVSSAEFAARPSLTVVR